MKKVKLTKKKNLSSRELEDRHEVLIYEAIEASSDQQDKLIDILRELDFVFIDSLTLTDRFPELGKKISRVKLKRYDWMLHLMKRAVNPEKDKYDPFVLVGISIHPKRDRKMIFIINKAYYFVHEMDLPNNLGPRKKKPALVKYPHWMTHDERNKWGREHRKLLEKKQDKPSKFYDKWKADIVVMGNLIIK